MRAPHVPPDEPARIRPSHPVSDLSMDVATLERLASRVEFVWGEWADEAIILQANRTANELRALAETIKGDRL